MERDGSLQVFLVNHLLELRPVGSVSYDGERWFCGLVQVLHCVDEQIDAFKLAEFADE